MHRLFKIVFSPNRVIGFLLCLTVYSCTPQTISARYSNTSIPETFIATVEIKSSPSPEREASSTVLPMILSSPTVNIQELSTPVLTPVCTQKKGKIMSTSLKSSLLIEPLLVRVYTPPCYEQEQKRLYPVLYLLHGQGFTDEQWDRIGADEAADKLISDGEIAPFIIVMPFDQSLTNPDNSAFGDVFLGTLIPWVDKTYRTYPDRAYRAIGGLSRGAAWAVHLGLSASEYFGSIGVHSGFFFAGEKDKTLQWLQKIPLNSLPRIRLDIGAEDDLRPFNDELEKMLVTMQIPHEWYLYPGRHEEPYWHKHLEEYMRWYAALW